MWTPWGARGGVVLLTTAGQPWHERPRSLPRPHVPPFLPDIVLGPGVTRSLPSRFPVHPRGEADVNGSFHGQASFIG